MTLIPTETFEISNIDSLTEKVKDFIKNSKSNETRRGYQSDWKQFEIWCSKMNIKSMPAQISTIVAYLSELTETHKVSTIERRLVSIKQAHRAAGYRIDKSDPLLIDTMKGIKNKHGKPQERKTPILVKDLQLMTKSLGIELKDIRDKAILLLGFTAALRRSEIVNIDIEHLHYKTEGFELLIPRSKTDQEGRGHITPIPYGSNPETCPVRALQNWINTAGIKEGPLFRAINKHGHISPKRMNSASIALIVKRNEYISEKCNDYSGHSLRAGFCTQAAANGVSDTQGMRHSRHKNFDTWRKYVRLATIWQDSAATKLGL